MNDTITIGGWRCPCGAALDLDTDRPAVNALRCRCSRCARVFEVTVIVLEVVPSAGDLAA